MRKLEKTELPELTSRAKRPVAALDRMPAPPTAIVAVPVLRKAAKAWQNGAPAEDRLSDAERLAEACGLARAIGLNVASSGLIPIAQPRPATLFGPGKLEELAGIVKAEDAGLVIVDHPLTPVQQRNLEKAWSAKVLDRTGLILEIFGARARTNEGRLQVELARLTYQKSRLVRSWTHLERQRGGFGFLGGPGETQIEADRRAIGERIDVIRKDLNVVERTRGLHRKRRKASRQPMVSLVGYTNAGKSTLFNALSGAAVFAQDMLFATLDPTMRRIKLGSTCDFILSDTVGFISDLPAQLIAAFKATLEEIVEADLILHVRDMSSTSPVAQSREVERVLTEIGIGRAAYDERVVEVWNKADLMAEGEKQPPMQAVSGCSSEAVVISANTGEGLPELLAVLERRLKRVQTTRNLVIDQGNGPLIHWLYENTEVVDRQDYHDGSLRFEVRVPVDREPQLDSRMRRQPAA